MFGLQDVVVGLTSFCWTERKRSTINGFFVAEGAMHRIQTSFHERFEQIFTPVARLDRCAIRVPLRCPTIPSKCWIGRTINMTRALVGSLQESGP